jgi:starch synthase (maltosyl-transferring)
MRKPEKMIIYNLFPLLAGKFSEWESHLKRASEMGFNWIFVNPIQYPGVSGSLYSVKDYFRFHPLLIDNESEKTPQEQVKEVMDTAGKYGLKVMVDLVINHCAVDSELIKEHPKWFLWEKKGRVAHPSCMENGKKVVWGDLAKFDYRHTKDKEGLFQYFFKAMKFLTELGFKGFRCDAAYQIPSSFWKRLIREIKARYPDVLFFAETLGCTTDQTRKTAGSGFDYIFNSAKWWDFHSPWLMEQYDLTRDIAPSVSFPESHDTVRLAEEFKGNINGLKQRYLFTALFSSGIMMPAGFEFGFRKRLHVVKTRPEDWEKTEIDLTSFIEKVNRIKAEHPVFQEEAPTEVLPSNNRHVLVMWKAAIHSREESLIIINKDINNHQMYKTDRLCDLLQSGAPCTDISPEHTVDFLPEPFEYDLEPGQGMVLVTSRDAVETE